MCYTLPGARITTDLDLALFSRWPTAVHLALAGTSEQTQRESCATPAVADHFSLLNPPLLWSSANGESNFRRRQLSLFRSAPSSELMMILRPVLMLIFLP